MTSFIHQLFKANNRTNTSPNAAICQVSLSKPRDKEKVAQQKFIRASSLHLSKSSCVVMTQCLARQSERLKEVRRIFSVLPRGFMLLGLKHENTCSLVGSDS